MSSGNGLRPRPGPAPKLIQGPKTGQRSLYHQQVLDEDTYTEALSHIITRDFFPNLPHLHATNDYLSALASNDPELLSSSIRRLARIAQDKEDGGRSRRGGSEEHDGDRARRREYEMAGTPYIQHGRTPVGARGWDTPRGDETVRRPREAEDAIGGSSRPSKKRKAVIRDDLNLDTFQRNYTSEDNASFVHVLEEENRVRREEINGWAFKAEKAAEDRRIAGEERRRLILDAATSGSWRVDANGRRLIGGLSEPGAHQNEGEAWKTRKLNTSGEAQQPSGEAAKIIEDGGVASSSALVTTQTTQAGALVRASDAAAASTLPPPAFEEQPLPESHPLSKALEKAGLPQTALVSNEDGKVVPYREGASGSGDGRGRGVDEKARRDAIERDIMGEEKADEHAGKVGQWPYKAMNQLMYPPDAYVKPFPKPSEPAGKPVANPPTINHRSTRINDDDDEPSGSRAASSRRGSSPARSWVDAAVKGTPYVPRSQRNGEDYSLLPNEADPEPEELPPLMTWGTLLATPRALDGSSDPLDFSGPTFRFPETKHRDDIGRKLGSKASKSMRERAAMHTPRQNRTTPSVLRPKSGSTLGSMGPPATPKREGNLTPAAKNLLDRSLGRTPQRGGGLGFGSGGGVRSSGFGKPTVGAKGWEASPLPRR